jgi:hypothetical protein
MELHASSSELGQDPHLIELDIIRLSEHAIPGLNGFLANSAFSVRLRPIPSVG